MTCDDSLLSIFHSLRRYLTDVANVDIYWFIGSQLDQVETLLSCTPLNGSSIVPWRYHFNTGRYIRIEGLTPRVV